MPAKLSKPNSVPTPDEFFDIALKECTPIEVVVLACVIKHTLKFGKQWDWISRAQLQSEINSSVTGTDIYKAVESLVQKDWLLRIYECAKCKSQSLEFSKGGECQNCGQKGLLHPYYALNLGDDLISHLNKIRPIGGVRVTYQPEAPYASGESGIEEVAYRQGSEASEGGLPIGKGVAYRQGGCLKATQETTIQETTIQETTTTTTDQTKAGDRGEKGLSPEEVGVEVVVKDFQDLVRYYKTHLIDPYKPNAPLELKCSDRDYLKLISDRYGIEVTVMLIDRGDNTSKHGGKLSLEWAVKQYEESISKPPLSDNSEDSASEETEDTLGGGGNNGKTNDLLEELHQRQADHEKELAILEKGEECMAAMSDKDWQDMLKKTAIGLKGSIIHSAVKAVENTEFQKKVWINTVKREVLKKLGTEALGQFKEDKEDKGNAGNA